MESIIRARSNGKLVVLWYPVTEEEVRKHGNVVINKYIKRAKKFALAHDKSLKKVNILKNLFILKAFERFCIEFET